VSDSCYRSCGAVIGDRLKRGEFGVGSAFADQMSWRRQVSEHESGYPEIQVHAMQQEATVKSVKQRELADWSARVYGRQKFAGAGKANSGLLVPLERRLARFVLPRVPRWLETYHLTLLTPVWAAGIVAFSYLAARDLRWMWMANLMIVFHYFTDHFDGKLGKYRDTGLFKWGFYMDHLFDYLFLSSILIGYSFLVPQRSLGNLLLVLCVFSAFMFHTFLMLAATEEFRVSFSRFGPTELRIGLIVCNGLLVKFGLRPLKGALPYVALCGTVLFALLAFRAQKKLWQSDMAVKQKK
jgi:phosphatidylglycerophosphate synthase